MPGALRRWFYRGELYYCPICQSKIRRFLVLHRDYHLWCPVCHSLHRHRVGWLLLRDILIDGEQKKCRMLHIAPEGFSNKLELVPELEYVIADMHPKKNIMYMDIREIQFPNGYFDLIYCSHVLEHIHDDRKALRELWRVLRIGGRAIIMVPILGEETYEDESITDPFERERFFGQYDHVRSYGLDFSQRLLEAGFQIEPIILNERFSADEIVRMGLESIVDNEGYFMCQKLISDLKS